MNRHQLCGCLLFLVAAAFACDYLTLDSLRHTLNLGSLAELRHWYAPAAWACLAAGSTLLALATFAKLVQPDGEPET